MIMVKYGGLLVDRYKKGKEMYLKYDCDYYFMALDGTLDIYKELRISPAIELIWKKSYLKDLMKKYELAIGDDRIQLLEKIAFHTEERTLIKIIEKELKRAEPNSYYMVRLCEVALHGISSNSYNVKRIFERFLSEINKIDVSNIVIDDSFYTPSYMISEFTEEKIKKRVKNVIEDLRDVLKI